MMLAKATWGVMLATTMAAQQAHAQDAPLEPMADQPVWVEDYAQALRQAQQERKMLLLHFAPAAGDRQANPLSRQLAAAHRQGKLDHYVLGSVRDDAEITVQGRRMRIIDHHAFAELRGQEGVVIIDYFHIGRPYSGRVVSVLRMSPGKYYRFQPEHVSVLLDLPPGTLTQRSMIFAVRIHPEAPGSAWGEKDDILISEASSHSRYQAQIQVQGHHHWDTRFGRIMGRLFHRGRRSAPVEVVAESWPNQDLMDSCVDCVHSWRQSDGHWGAVKAQQASYGYDIQRGGNGIWYATGIFAR